MNEDDEVRAWQSAVMRAKGPLFARLTDGHRHLIELGIIVEGVELGSDLLAYFDGVPLARVLGLPITISEDDPAFVGFIVRAP